jgi:catechol 2,3-dioxygenase-like lactoylglutathione lyase family enzyme
MKVKRIVSNIKASALEKADAFYKDIFGIDLVMDHG